MNLDAAGRRPYVTARWESLLFLNYECPPALLEPHVPAGTLLDPWRGTPLVSLVGFMFRDTRLRGVRFPGHHTFEEVNLRFYVRRETPEGETRRGVVFLRELVSRRVIATVARVAYNEPYVRVPMSHRVDLDLATGGTAEYAWRYGSDAFAMRGTACGPATDSERGSEAAFITEHHWGYTRQRDGGTLEYEVEHPRWPVWRVGDATFAGDAASLYRSAFAEILAGPPRSAYLAPGSDVRVHVGKRIVHSLEES